MSGSPAIRRLNLVRISHHVPLDDDDDDDDNNNCSSSFTLRGSPGVRRRVRRPQSAGSTVSRQKQLDKQGKHNWECEDVTSTISHHVPDDRATRTLPRRFRFRNFSQAPEFVKRLNAFEEAESGSTVTFECQFRAFPKPAIKWYKDDEEITEDDSYVVEEGENGVVRLVLEHVYKADEGAYKCKAENQEGVASTTGYLSVTGDNGDRPLSTQDRGEHEDRCVSFPPHLRTIIEQKSMEEREEEEAERQGPSPIQEFIDNIEHFKKSKTWPYFENGRTERVRDDDEESNGSVTSVDSQDYERFKVISPPHSPLQSDTDSTTQLPVTHTPDTQPVMPPVAANRAVCCREDSPPCERVDTVAVKDYSMTLTDVFRDLTYHVGNLMDGLQFPWLYYMGLSVLACMAGVSTQCPVMLFVGLIAVVTLTSFRFLMITS